MFTVVCVHQGNVSVTVCHGGDPIPKSPFNISVAPPLDLNKVKVQGLNNSEYLWVWSEFYLSLSLVLSTGTKWNHFPELNSEIWASPSLLNM